MTSRIKEYKRVRKAGMDLNNLLIEEISQGDTGRAARMLGILKGERQLDVDAEEESLLADFMIHDVFDKQNRSVAARFFAKNGGSLGTLQIAILEGLSRGYCSLFEILEIDPKAGTVLIRDVLEEREALEIIDLGLSKSPSVIGALAFFRIFEVNGLWMTSGAPMLFEGHHKATLIKKYKLRALKVKRGTKNTRRSVAFFKLNRRYGHPGTMTASPV